MYMCKLCDSNTKVLFDIKDYALGISGHLWSKLYGDMCQDVDK